MYRAKEKQMSIYDYLPPYHGELRDKNRWVRLAEAIDWALDLSPDEVRKIAKAGIKNVHDNFTKDIMCEKTVAVYKELLNNQ